MSGISKGNVGRGALWSIVNQSIAQILSLLVFLVTARFVTKEAFGIIAACMLVVEAFRQVWAESISTSLIAKRDPSGRDYNACFLIIATGGALFSGIAFLLANPIASLLAHPDIAPTLRWISLLLLIGGLSRTHETWLSKNLQFKVLALRSLLSICTGGGIGIYMAVRGYGLLSLIAQQLVTSLVSTACLWLSTAWRPAFDTSWTNIAAQLRYSRYISLTAAASFANTQSDVFFSSYYLGSAPTGVYNAAKRIQAAISIMFSSSLNSVALPTLATVSADPERSSRGFLRVVGMTSTLSAPLYAGLAIMSPDLVHILMGDKWAEVAPILSILAVVGYTNSLAQYNNSILLVRNRPHWQTYLTMVSATVNVLLFIVFGRFGLIALATSYACKNVLFAPISTYFALFLLKITPRAYLAKVAPSVAAAIIMSGAAVLAQRHFGTSSIVFRLFVLLPAEACIYLGVLAFLDRNSLSELLTIARDAFDKH